MTSTLSTTLLPPSLNFIPIQQLNEFGHLTERYTDTINELHQIHVRIVEKKQEIGKLLKDYISQEGPIATSNTMDIREKIREILLLERKYNDDSGFSTNFMETRKTSFPDGINNNKFNTIETLVNERLTYIMSILKATKLSNRLPSITLPIEKFQKRTLKKVTVMFDKKSKDLIDDTLVIFDNWKSKLIKIIGKPTKVSDNWMSVPKEIFNLSIFSNTLEDLNERIESVITPKITTDVDKKKIKEELTNNLNNNIKNIL